MAKIEFKGIDDYRARIAALGARAESTCKYAIYPGAGIVADAIRKATPVDTGDLRESLTVDKMQNKDGFIYTTIHFSGYDRKGTPNPIKARVLESGSSTRVKRPFIRPAVNRVRKQAESSIASALDEKINEIMKEG